MEYIYYSLLQYYIPSVVNEIKLFQKRDKLRSLDRAIREMVRLVLYMYYNVHFATVTSQLVPRDIGSLFGL